MQEQKPEVRAFLSNALRENIAPRILPSAPEGCSLNLGFGDVVHICICICIWILISPFHW